LLKKRPPGAAFGITTYSETVPHAPEVVTKPAAKAKGVVVQKTQATPVACESFFAKAGSGFRRTLTLADQKTKLPEEAQKCRQGVCSRTFTITSEGAAKIGEAEMEHCDDLKHAFDISLGCYANVVNGLAAASLRTPLDSHEDAVRAATERSGRDPGRWTQRYLDLLAKTRKRDANGWHTAVDPPGPRSLEIDRAGQCTCTPAGVIDGGSYPAVGKHATADLIV
jgi:hypothetical protein